MWKTGGLIHRDVDKKAHLDIFVFRPVDSCLAFLHTLHKFWPFTGQNAAMRHGTPKCFHSVHNLWITLLWMGEIGGSRGFWGFFADSSTACPQMPDAPSGGRKCMHNAA